MTIDYEKQLYLWCKNKEYSMENTFLKYRTILRQVLGKFPNLDTTPLTDIQEYTADITNPNTRKNTLVVIRWAFNTVLHKPIDWRDLPYPQKVHKLQAIYTQSEVVRIIEATKNPKQKALLALIVDTGMRCSEPCSILLSDCKIDEQKITIRQAKGRKDRAVFPSAYVWELLFDYLEHHHKTPEKLLFEGEQIGMPYTTSSIRQFVERSCKIAGVEYKGIHSFRRFNGSWKVQNGVPETVVADLLGNSVKTLHKHYLIHNQDYLRGTISPLQNIY